MFEVGDFVINANNGICKVEDIVHLDLSISNKDRLYYLLVPLEEKATKLYIPVDSDKQRIRSTMSKDEALKLVDSIPEIEEIGIENDKQRETQYKEAIFSCEPQRLISILKTMYSRNKLRIAEGKKNTMIDERYFKIAENNLYGELAFAMQKNRDEMQTIIEKRMKHLEMNT